MKRQAALNFPNENIFQQFDSIGSLICCKGIHKSYIQIETCTTCTCTAKMEKDTSEAVDEPSSKVYQYKGENTRANHVWS